jgi:hypothetical protein
MPVPIICLEIALSQYAEAFRQVFTLPQFRHLVTVLLGSTLTPERRTLTGLLSGVTGGHSLRVFSRFFSQAPWSPQELACTWLKGFRQPLVPPVPAEHQRQQVSGPATRGPPKPTQVTALAIFDHTTIDQHLQGEPGSGLAITTAPLGASGSRAIAWWWACWRCGGDVVPCHPCSTARRKGLKPKECPSRAPIPSR